LLKRLQDHLIKATREAMVHTRWTRPNQSHEDALLKFVSRILSTDDGRDFLDDFRQFQKKVAYFGMINGLSQTLLKIASPGVPDFYQGSEVWDLRLVDPDNRGPVDFARRAAALDSLARADAADAGQTLHDLVEHWRDGCIKLYLVWKAIRFRRDHADLFRDGEFIPLRSAGTYSRNVSAFLRRQAGSWALAAIPLWPSQVPAKGKGLFNWGDTRLTLPPESPLEWNNILAPGKASARNEAGEQYMLVEELLQGFPVAFFNTNSN
jgi:(1->4)-alpha-D-glucan 1-alpha-D-glucosylmutase